MQVTGAAASLGFASEVAVAAAVGSSTAHAVPGDVTDPAHRQALADAAAGLGGADLLVNNASTLGASPMPRLADLTHDVLDDVLLTNVVAPHALTRALLPQLVARRGTVLNITSDASVEPYEGWGAYGASKAALDHLTRILAAEQPDLRVPPGARVRRRLRHAHRAALLHQQHLHDAGAGGVATAGR